jgi:hypothetical protein
MEKMNININKDKNIGRVLFIVEGLKTEFDIINKIFTKIFDYKYEKFDRLGRYCKHNSKSQLHSSVFVINTENSSIKSIGDANHYLDNLFVTLIEKYRFPVHKAAIFYLFDRDVKSNQDAQFIADLLTKLTNSRISYGFNMPGLLLLSYPSIESFILSNFTKNCFDMEFELGKTLKRYLCSRQIHEHQIKESTLLAATQEMLSALHKLGIDNYDIDNFGETNLEIFNKQEAHYLVNQKYRLLSLICIALIDLGLIEIQE